MLLPLLKAALLSKKQPLAEAEMGKTELVNSMSKQNEQNRESTTANTAKRLNTAKSLNQSDIELIQFFEFRLAG